MPLSGGFDRRSFGDGFGGRFLLVNLGLLGYDLGGVWSITFSSNDLGLPLVGNGFSYSWLGFGSLSFSGLEGGGSVFNLSFGAILRDSFSGGVGLFDDSGSLYGRLGDNSLGFLYLFLQTATNKRG